MACFKADWLECVQCSAKRLAPHLAVLFPSTVGLSLEFVAVKKFGKELGTENHNSGVSIQRSIKLCEALFQITRE